MKPLTKTMTDAVLALKDPKPDFDSTLTAAEHVAKTFLEWPDATIARCVRHCAEEIKDGRGFNAVAMTACLKLLAYTMDVRDAQTMKLVSTGDRPGGEYKLNVKMILKRKAKKKS